MKISDPNFKFVISNSRRFQICYPKFAKFYIVKPPKVYYSLGRPAIKLLGGGGVFNLFAVDQPSPLESLYLLDHGVSLTV